MTFRASSLQYLLAVKFLNFKNRTSSKYLYWYKEHLHRNVFWFGLKVFCSGGDALTSE